MTVFLFIVLNENLPLSDALQFCTRENLSETMRKSAGILTYFKLFRDVSDDFISAKPISPYVSEPKAPPLRVGDGAFDVPQVGQ